MPVQHIVLLQFKVGTSDATVAEIFQKLERLTRVIPGITSFSFGVNISPEGLAQGFTHGLTMTFKDAVTRDAYLVHPEHEQFKAEAISFVANVVVLDYSI
jgi:hypothetical protein